LLSYDSDTKKDKELAPAEIALLSLKNFFDKQNNKANLRSRIVREIENNGDRTI
jgi:hypothetical protein